MIHSTFAGFYTALTAVQANQKRLDITGHNLANMNTTGYTRQQLETSSLNYTKPIAHYMNGSENYVGFGTHMNKVSQIRDPYLDIQYREQMSKSGYTDSMQTSLDSLARVLDETQINGIRSAFDDIQTAMINMQDHVKVGDAIYDSELRSRMQTLTNLLNDAARQIVSEENNEYSRLDGEGTSEQGAVQVVNEYLRRIGELNNEIKRNQILGQQSLELMDERNVLLDELSSYIPIEVTYYKDAQHAGENEYIKDQYGNIIDKRDWPDDLRVQMIYTDEAGNSKRLTLIDGSEGMGTGVKNYGELTIKAEPLDPADPDGPINPLTASITFTAAPSRTPQGDEDLSTTACFDKSQFASGSIQAGLDMLGKTGSGITYPTNKTVDDVRGYQYYMDKLDTLASSFAEVMNFFNNKKDTNNPKTDHDLLVDKTGSGTGITALNIGINPDWVSGKVGISMEGDNPNDTILNLLEAMNRTYPTNDGFGPTAGVNLGNKTFTDYMNNTSTVLANDSLRNTYELKNNVTVLNGIQDSRDSMSGVSLDEEATNMMTYLSAYNAASRIMTAMDEALNTLINGMGLVGR